METTEKRSLVRKLAEVTAALGRIPKNGFNKFHQYHYVLEADVVEAVRGEYAKRRLVLFPSVVEERTDQRTTKSGGLENLVTLKVDFTIEDGESGEARTFTIIGQGQDAGDKGPYKAMTGAVKYAVMKLHDLPTGDEPEAEDAPHEAVPARSATKPQPPPPAQRAATPHDPRTGEVGAVFPNYGRAKGMPVKGASFDDLQWYLAGAKRSLADPAKARFHAQEQALLDAINAELNASTKTEQGEVQF